MQIDRVKLISEMARQRMTTRELADKSGVSRATISYIRNGKSCLDVVGKAIANALGVKVKDLLED